MRIKTERKFSAAHRLPNYDGKCSRLHGHTWKVEVAIEGEPDVETGMLMDFVEIKNIIDDLDHQYLNDFINNPTVENIAKYILDHLARCQPRSDFKIRVWETEDSFAEVDNQDKTASQGEIKENIVEIMGENYGKITG